MTSTRDPMRDSIEEIEDAIRGLLKTEIGLTAEGLASDAKLADLGVDSVKVLRLVVKLEQRYRIELEDEVIFRAETLRDLAVTIRSLVAPGAS